MNPPLLNNRYRTLQKLGAGGFGNTFLAEDTYMPSGRRCVIKQLKPVTNDPQMYKLIQQRFQREAAALEDLGEGSNQIPKLFAYFSENGQFYLVQEFIDGLTLTKMVQQQGKIPENTVREILGSLLPVLDYVHGRRMVHRDIKPDNIIVRQRDNKPVLIDFGAVKESMGAAVSSDDSAAPSIVIGTPGFMPPEQAAGQPVYASDLYSLGLTAVYLLTGKQPQELQTDPRTGEILWRQSAGGTSPSLVSVLDKTIQSHPRDRYSTAREMLDALQSGAVPPYNPDVSMQPTVAVAPGGQNHAGSSPHTPPVVTPPAPARPAGVGQGNPQKILWIGGSIAAGLVALAVAFGLLSKRSPAPTPLASSPQPTAEAPTRSQTPSPDPDRSPPKRSEVTPPPIIPESPSLEPTRSPSPEARRSPSPEPRQTRTPQARRSPVPEPARSPSPEARRSPVPEPARSRDPVFPRSPVPEATRSPSPEATRSPRPLFPRTPEPETGRSLPPDNNNQNPNPASNSVPAFPVGTLRNTVEATLGPADRDVRGLYGRTRAVVYSLVPNQIDLGYLFDRDSGRIRQTEASFGESVDPQVMLTALDGMLEGGSSDYIKQGLRRVQQRRSSSYTFTQGSLRGQIVRQTCGFIYISIWEENLHDFDVDRARRC